MDKLIKEDPGVVETKGFKYIKTKLQKELNIAHLNIDQDTLIAYLAENEEVITTIIQSLS